MPLWHTIVGGRAKIVNGRREAGGRLKMAQEGGKQHRKKQVDERCTYPCVSSIIGLPDAEQR